MITIILSQHYYSVITIIILQVSIEFPTELYTIYTDPPPSAQFNNITLDNMGGNLSITVLWNNSFSQQFHIDEYCVQLITQETIQKSSCPWSCVPPTSPYICSELHDGLYTFIVYAVNCNFQNGNKSELIFSSQGIL